MDQNIDEDWEDFKDKLNLSTLKDEDYEKLTIIDVSHCNLTELPAVVGRLFSLQILIADQNLIESLPSTLSQLAELRKLSVSHNKLSCLPNSFSNLHFLEILNLSYNDFDLAPIALQAGCAEITQLNMSHNILEEWNEKPMCARALRDLDLSFNHLRSNPEWLWGASCLSLENLNLSNNKFKNPSSVVKHNLVFQKSTFGTLHSLNLSQCGLTSNDLTLLHECQALTFLEFGNNTELAKHATTNRKKSLVHCDNIILSLSFKPLQSKLSLRELVISSLGLPFLPDDINCLEVLEVIDCSFNELQWLPESISALSNLRTAVFSNNRLLYLPENFGKLKMLQELWLDCNQLEDLPPSFCDLQELKWLDLYSNLLDELPLALKKLMPNLCGLDVGYNMISDQNELIDLSNPHYESIKIALRKYPQLGIERNLSRTDANKPQVDIVSSASSDDSEEDEHSSSSDSNDPEESRDKESSEEEMWDLRDDDEEDWFDPTCEPHPSANSSSSQNTCHLYIRDSFCPADIHAAPSVKIVKDSLKPDEGQFDDA